MLEGSILEKLVSAHQGTKRPINLGVYYKNTLVALCHALEDFILDSEGNPLMITAFQRGKWYLQEAQRYGEIATKAQDIVIMATPDAGFDAHPTSQLANVTLISLDKKDPVTEEWHLMILSPQYTAMVLCQELSETDYGSQGKPTEDLERKFYGFWTFEPELVQETVELAISHLAHYNPSLAHNLTEAVIKMSDASSHCQKDDVGMIVTRVVNYLETSQQNLAHPDIYASQELDNNLLSNQLQAFLRMAQLIEQGDVSNPQATTEVSALVEAMGQLLDLPAWQLKRLRLAGLLHRLAPIQGVNQLEEYQSPVQQEAIEHKDILPQASVLRIMPQLQAIAKIIIHQTELWDGSGFPKGLAYDSIPLESRILGLIIYFQQRLTIYKQQAETNYLLKAFTDCENLATKAFDPKLIESLALLVMGMQQGMSLKVTPPKIAAGMWLLDTD